MQSEIETIKSAIKKLSARDYDAIGEWFEERKKKPRIRITKTPEEVAEEVERFNKNLAWIQVNREEYMNQWVCVENGELVSHGEDSKLVYDEARNKGIKIPFVDHIVEELPWGGW